MPNATAILHHSDAESRNRSPDWVLARLAQGQHGVVSRSQLAAARLGRGAIELRLRRGRLHRVHAGVFAVGHCLLDDEGRWMAAVLAGGEGAVLSHVSAASLWEIRPSQSKGIDVTTPRKLHSRAGLRFHCSSLPTDEVTVRNGIPVTTVPRTLFDLAAVITRRQLERAVNEAEVRHLWDALSLGDLLERHPRRPGVAAIRALIDEPGRRVTRSDLEDLFLNFLQEKNLPLPATNLPLRLDGGWIEPDCVWREQRLIVELDGHATHGTPAAYEDDRARDRALTAAGWRVIRVTWRQLHGDRSALARDLRASLAGPPAANLRRA